MNEFVRSFLPAYLIPGTKKLRPSKWVALAFLFLLTLVPLHYTFTGSTWFVKLFISANIFAIFAMSWDFISGYTGQENLGHHFFVGIGSFLVGLFTVSLVKGALIEGQNLPPIISFHLHPIILILLGGFLAALFGLLIGIPCLRLEGLYLGLATLATGLIFFEFTDSILPTLHPVLKAHSTEGIYGLPKLVDHIVIFYFIIYVFLFLVLFFLYTYTRSNYGLILKAIKEDEIATKAVGINTTFYKVSAFVVSAFIAGIAGTLFAYNIEAVSPYYVDTFLLVKIISICIVGGMGTITGGFGGSYFLVLLLLGMDEASRFLEDVTDISEIRDAYKIFEDIFYYGCIVLVMLFMPDGVITTAIRKTTDWYQKKKSPQKTLLKESR